MLPNDDNLKLIKLIAEMASDSLKKGETDEEWFERLKNVRTQIQKKLDNDFFSPGGEVCVMCGK